MNTSRIRIALCLAPALLAISCQTNGFGRLDADRDSQLSFDEFGVATAGKAPDAGAAFIKADTDRDGALSATEYQVYVSTYAGR